MARKKRNRCPFCGCRNSEHVRLRAVLDESMAYYSIEPTAENRAHFIDQLVLLIKAGQPERKDGDE
jgi:hypothetical protein